MKRLIYFILGLLLLAGVMSAWGWNQYRTFLATPLPFPSDGVVVTIAEGMSGRAVIRQLASRAYTRDSWHWRILMRLEPLVLKAGEYDFSGPHLPRAVLERLSSGRVVQYPFTLVEGWTWAQIVEYVEGQESLPRTPGWREEVTGLVDGPPEGWFLPETYLFSRGDTVIDVLRRAHSEMKLALQESWSSRAIGHPLKSPYEMLILASIVERETALDSEREQVAGVFVRRLIKGMRLQADPTVIYGLGDAFDGDIRRRDLTTDTPYNTYTRHGLPPTPIAMPSRRSLEAVAQPDNGETLYFVADGKGGHTFSVTLEEHQKAVQELIRKP